MRIFRDIKSLPSFKRSVITIGSFDGVHRAHQKIIKQVKRLASEIRGESIIITFDPHPRSIIYPKDDSLRLLTDIDEKLEILAKLGIDNVVVVPFSFEFSRQSPQEYVERFIIENFNPEYVVLGYDHKFGLNRAGDIHLLKQYEEDGKFKLVEIQQQQLDDITISSTQIRKSLLSGEILIANNLLKHTYMLTGKVIHGKEIGTSLGFPTANLKLNEEKKLIPKQGVYAVRVIHDDYQYDGMMHIGNRPSLNDGLELSIEVNIFDFNQIIYNDQLRVEIVAYIRANEKFDHLDELKKQLTQDKADVIHLLNRYKTKVEDCKVAIAILNYNGSEHLQSYLASVSFSSQEKFKIYVIDNGSTDDSVDYIQEYHPEVELIKLQTNYGFAEGYNKGIQFIKEPLIAILNSDVKVEPNWIDPILKAMNNDHNIGACQAKILSLEDAQSYEYAGAAGGFLDYLAYPFCRGRIFDHIEEDHGQYDEESDIHWASGAAMVVRKQIFLDAGGFDRKFFAHQEEIDLCWRMRLHGHTIRYIPQSVVFHLGGGTLDYENPKKTYLNFRNNLMMLLKNDMSGFRILKFISRLILDGIAGLKMILDGKWQNCLAVIRAHFGVYKRLPYVIGKRRQLKESLKARGIKGKNPSFYNKSIVYQYFVKGRKSYQELID